MTLDALIEQQLSLGKKLGEFKAQNKGWLSHKQYFIPYFKDEEHQQWHGLDQHKKYDCYGLEDNDWHLYTEPKVKKKYWLYYMNDCGWYLNSFFYDEDGIDTIGNKRFEYWDNTEKRKSDIFIELDE